MKKLLIIALLVVGCGTEPEDTCDICDVAWLISDSKIYWTSGYKPETLIDTEIKIKNEYPDNFIQLGNCWIDNFEYWWNEVGDSILTNHFSQLDSIYDANQYLNEPLDCQSVYDSGEYDYYFCMEMHCSNYSSFFSYVFNNDTLQYADSVMSISHFVIPNYFETIDADSIINTIIYSDNIKYEYK